MSYAEVLTFADDDSDDHGGTYQDRFLQGGYP